MKRALVHAALSLSMLIVVSRSVSPPWVQTNWLASSSFFNLYSSQDKVFARTWDSLNGGRMFLTADDGANWTQISSADSDIDVLSVVMLTSSILAGTWNGLNLSTDGGATWNAITPTGIPADTAIWSTAMIDTALFAGTTGDIYVSSDIGSTWTKVDSGIPDDARITSFVASGDAIFAGSASNGIFKTTDGGTNWTTINSGLTDTHVSQIAAAGTGLLAVTLNGVFLSDNGGASWAADSSGLANVNCFVFVDSELFAGTDDDGVYLSVDSGATWTSVASGMPAHTRVWSLAASGGYIFAGTDSGVWRIPISTVTYTISASASAGGTIAPDGDITVNENGSQAFTITPYLGYAVSDVLVDGMSVGAVASYTFSSVTADHSISASFNAVPTYSITASATPGGTISPSGSVVVSEGSSQTFTISPSPGYQIASVLVDGGSVGAVSSYTFSSVAASHTISATFNRLTTISGDVSDDGQVNSTDALIVLSADVGRNTSQFCPMNCGDVNGDGYVDSTDALIILSYDVGMSVPFPIGEPGCSSSVTQPVGCSF
jgi:hypothetical protein